MPAEPELQTNLADPPAERGVYCNRTLNLRAIRAIGYDMDYTLVRYNVQEWELTAYAHLQRRLVALGWPVEHLSYEPNAVMRGLFIDRELGNLVKANRFGYVKQAAHGTRMLGFEKHKDLYSRTLVELSDKRYSFINELFALSEAQMYMQLVDLLDAGRLPANVGYRELHAIVRRELDEAHVEGKLKAEITSDPDRFVDIDEEMPLTLLDQQSAGKKLLLITNSDWQYSRQMMSHVIDPFMPGDETWLDLFDLVMVSAQKPDFFASRTPAFQLIDDEGSLRLVHGRRLTDKIYVAGNADLVESHLALGGGDILFVGDHMYSDVNVSKNVRRWRTALIMPELEDELVALRRFRDEQQRLTVLMEGKERLETRQARVRALQERPHSSRSVDAAKRRELQQELSTLRTELGLLDEKISPLARASAEIHNSRWGPLMRTGRDKSHLARQVERHADIYTSRVSNLLFETPYGYLRSPRGSLPHDPGYTPDPMRPLS